MRTPRSFGKSSRLISLNALEWYAALATALHAILLLGKELPRAMTLFRHGDVLQSDTRPDRIAVCFRHTDQNNFFYVSTRTIGVSNCGKEVRRESPKKARKEEGKKGRQGGQARNRGAMEPRKETKRALKSSSGIMRSRGIAANTLWLHPSKAHVSNSHSVCKWGGGGLTPPPPPATPASFLKSGELSFDSIMPCFCKPSGPDAFLSQPVMCEHCLHMGGHVPCAWCPRQLQCYLYSLVALFRLCLSTWIRLGST